ncbi:MAG: hypothetical protein CMB56_000665 [Methanobacteriota archaeon]|nr:MAG: hypothetical protein CMB56_000665 [Euryarchaeota archaeon]|tara:strand:+ start:3155 stop:4465 length:1311 start_codon:yes stop_codon:yes gene_type:complete
MQINSLEMDEIKYARRFDIDWLRVILFALLIWFHYAMFSLDQLFKDNSGIGIINLSLIFLLDVMHQWRLAALFIISGMGTAFAFRRKTWKRYIKERAIRLGLPLMFGTYILWLGIFSPIVTTQKLFTIFPGIDEMPYGHLWFIYNLLIYSIVLTPFFSYIQQNPNGTLIKSVEKIMNIRRGIGMLIFPALILSFNGIIFKPWKFGEVGMWWEFPRYFLYFLFGYLMISTKNIYFPMLEKLRIPLTIVTPMLSIIWYILKSTSKIPSVMEGGWVQKGFPAFSFDIFLATFIQSFHTWFWCIFIFSWSSKLLNRPSKWLKYLNEAVYPTYIVHMHLTFLPIAIFALLGIGYYSGLVLGSVFVMVGVIICFEIVRRASLFRIFFGLKGGKESLYQIFPFNKTKTRESKFVLSLLSNAVAFGMIFGLLLFLITAGLVSKI